MALPKHGVFRPKVRRFLASSWFAIVECFCTDYFATSTVPPSGSSAGSGEARDLEGDGGEPSPPVGAVRPVGPSGSTTSKQERKPPTRGPIYGLVRFHHPG